MEYLATHAISDKLNRIVNDLCRSRPRDPWLFLSDALSDLQTEAPLIDRVTLILMCFILCCLHF